MTAVVFAVPKWVATAAKALFGKATGNVIVVCLEKYIHCLLMANCDDPYGRVCPTYIISFITLDASCPW